MFPPARALAPPARALAPPVRALGPPARVLPAPPRRGWLGVCCRISTGQPAPFSHYPLIAGGVVVVALIYGAIVYGRDRTLGERVGSVVADAD
jgi:hypothetical protein